MPSPTSSHQNLHRTITTTLIQSSMKRQRGFIQPPISSSGKRVAVRRSTGGNSNRQSSVLEEDLYGIPLEIWEDKLEDEPIEPTVVCRTVDEADNAPEPQQDQAEVLKPITTNLLGVNISGVFNQLSDEEFSDMEEEDKENCDPSEGLEKIREREEEEAACVITIPDTIGQTETIPEAESQTELLEEPILDEFIADNGSSATEESVIDDFHMALMIFTATADISTNQYKALVEVLSMVTSLDSITTLPKSLKTLRERARKTFPLADLKGRAVQLNSEVVPVSSKTDIPNKAYYFDISQYCKLWLSNPQMMRHMHFGFGEIVDNASELWHGEAWMESIRTTSGKFAYINEQSPTNIPGHVSVQRQILLPSDCVIFREPSGAYAMGRVKCIGVDRRVIAGRPSNTLCAIINRLVPLTHLPPPWRYELNDDSDILSRNNNIKHPYPPGHSVLPELVMIENREIIPCMSILKRVWVYFTDYETVSELRESILPQEPSYCVRSIAYMASAQGEEDKPMLRSVYLRHRVSAEIELNKLTRKYVLENMVDPPNGQDIPRLLENVSGDPALSIRRISVPFSVFLDGFGLYRNAYHSLKGMYITPAGLSIYERERLVNLFVLMIGPFGCNEVEMAACLREDGVDTGNGIRLTLYSGEVVFATAFPLLFTGDMPQQNQNAGNKTHLAEYGCRSCMVQEKNRGNLKLDIVGTGRYMGPTQRYYEASIKLSQSAREKALQTQGLSSAGPYFTKTYTMLDPQKANPNDCMHAELRLAKYFHEALLEGILSTAGVAAYREAWEDISTCMPYQWGKPQNPVNHKGSMVLSEHGRVAMIHPFVLMHMFTNDGWRARMPIRERNRLRASYLKKDIAERITTAFSDEIVAGTDHRHQIIRTAFSLASTIYLTLKDTLSPSDRRNFNTTVLEMRHNLRRMFACASTKENTFKNYANVPNIHLALHYQQDIMNFGTTRNATTMMGEQKHKVFKIHAPHTNSRDNDLQLMKMTNTIQTLRFMLEGTFNGAVNSDGGDTIEGRVSAQVTSIVSRCSTLSVFLGQATGSKEAEEGITGNIDDSRSRLIRTRVGKYKTAKEIKATTRSADITDLFKVYKTDYGVDLIPGMQIKIHYWGYMGGDPRPDPPHLTRPEGKPRRFRTKIGDIVKLIGNPTFYKVVRLITTTMGAMVRVFMVLLVLERVNVEELTAAPYPVLRTTKKEIIVGIEKLDPRILHIVNKGDDKCTWWLNPLVPYFL